MSCFYDIYEKEFASRSKRRLIPERFYAVRELGYATEFPEHLLWRASNLSFSVDYDKADNVENARKALKQAEQTYSERFSYLYRLGEEYAETYYGKPTLFCDFQKPEYSRDTGKIYFPISVYICHKNPYEEEETK